jgi:hypothetical protein
LITDHWDIDAREFLHSSRTFGVATSDGTAHQAILEILLLRLDKPIPSGAVSISLQVPKLAAQQEFRPKRDAQPLDSTSVTHPIHTAHPKIICLTQTFLIPKLCIEETRRLDCLGAAKRHSMQLVAAKRAAGLTC